jgi:hypothetical protein
LLDQRPLAKIKSFRKRKSWVKLPKPFAVNREKLRDSLKILLKGREISHINHEDFLHSGRLRRRMSLKSSAKVKMPRKWKMQRQKEISDHRKLKCLIEEKLNR